MTTSRRSALALLATGAAAVATAKVRPFSIGHAWARDVFYDGGTFDAGGATLRISQWGGFWEVLLRRLLLDDFEKAFNCTVVNDPSFPWAPDFLGRSASDPPFGLSNWNLGEMFQVAQSGDYFLPQEEVLANVPTSRDCWPFALSNGIGVTWSYGRLCYAYRVTPGVPVPTRFDSLWDEAYAGRRMLIDQANDIFKAFFLTCAAVFGESQRDWHKALDALRRLTPIRSVHFSHAAVPLLENGTVDLVLQADAEVFARINAGMPVAVYLWDQPQTILTQTLTVSRYAPPMEKRLAFALLDRMLSVPFQEAFIAAFPFRPSNADAAIPGILARHGVANTFEATDSLWIPNWVWWNQAAGQIEPKIRKVLGG